MIWQAPPPPAALARAAARARRSVMEFRIAALILFGLTLGILHAEHNRHSPLAGLLPGFGRASPVQISDGLAVSRSLFDPVALPVGSPRFVQVN